MEAEAEEEEVRARAEAERGARELSAAASKAGLSLSREQVP